MGFKSEFSRLGRVLRGSGAGLKTEGDSLVQNSAVTGISAVEAGKMGNLQGKSDENGELGKSVSVSVKRGIGKKILIACDGTWENGDQGYDDSQFAPPTAQIPTNITRLVRALRQEDDEGVQQVAYYQRGVGSDGGAEGQYVGGLTGYGLSDHVRESYAFLSNNYGPRTQADLENPSIPMDEIVIMGFSRGAFTARAISSLVSDVGLLTHVGMESFWGIFGDWMKQNIVGKESEWFEHKYGEKVSFTDPRYRQTLIDKGLTRWPTPIRAVGVFDTVGALGIPISFGKANVKEYSFVNTKVPRQVEHAFHAMALDEHRNLFTPTLWESPTSDSILKTLSQCWFPGVHSNIGGSYADAGIANITLAWMISKLEDTDGGILSFDPVYLDWLQDLNNSYYAKFGKYRAWSDGQLYDSAPVTTLEGIAQGAGAITRTPGRYNVMSSQSGKETTAPLFNTNETIHASVRARINDGGMGTEEGSVAGDVNVLMEKEERLFGKRVVQKYTSAALRNYELVQPAELKGTENGNSVAFWKAKDGGKGLEEDVLGKTEVRLLRRSVAMEGTSGTAKKV